MTPPKSGNLSFVRAEAVFDVRLSHAAVRVLAALGTYADKGGQCWPSAPTLAERLGICERHVRRCLERLERHGYIITEHRVGQSNIYRIPRTQKSEVEAAPRTSIAGVPRTQGAGVGPDPGSGEPVPRTWRAGHPGSGEPPNDTKNDTNNDYAFGGKVIRLNQRDFDTWAKSYPHIDLRAELQALDDWYDGRLTEAERKNWFARCSGALAKKNREAKTRAPGRSTYNPDVIH